jgi:hypothetical protein
MSSLTPNTSYTIRIRTTCLPGTTYPNTLSLFSDTVTFVTSGIANRLENLNSIVYPNPAKDYINLNMNYETDKESEVLIFDCQGRLLKTYKQLVIMGYNTITIDIKELSNGFYILKSDGRIFRFLVSK